MAIGYRGAWTYSAANPTGSQNISLSGTNAVAGDVAIVIIYSRDGDAAPKDFGTISGPTALNSTPVNTTNGGKIYAGYKVLTATDITNGYLGTWAPTTDTNATTGVVVSVYSGVDGTNPVRSSVAPVSGGADTQPNPPSISTTSGDALVVYFGSMDDDANSGADTNPPANFTLGGNWSTTSGTDASSAVAYDLDGGTGSSVDPAYFDLISGAAQYWYAGTIALKPRRDGSAEGSADLTGGRTGTAEGSASLYAPQPMHLEVPIEMVDVGISGATTGAVTFNRSKVNFDTDDYDGSPSYYFEIVAYNSTGANANVILRNVTDASDAVTIVVAGSTTPTRYRSSFTPGTGAKVYAVTMPQTGTDNTVRVYAARIIVIQTHPTKTRIQIPMTGTFYGNTYSADTGDQWLMRTLSTTPAGDANYCRVFSKTNANWATVATNGWTLEAVACMSGGSNNGVIQIYNNGTGAGVPAQITTVNGTTPTLYSTDFSNTATYWDSGANARIEVAGDNTYYCQLLAARLYVRLTNVTKVEVHHRMMEELNAGNTSLSVGHHRQQINSSNYVGNTVEYYTEAYGYCYENVVAVQPYSVNSTSSTSGSAVTGAGINFYPNSANARIRGSSWTPPTSGYDLYFVRLATTSNSHTVAMVWIVIITAEAAGGGSYTNSTATGSADLQKSLTGTADGSASLKKAFSDSNATGAADLKKAFTDANASGSADLKKSLTGTADGSADLKKAFSGSSDGAADLKKSLTGTAEGAAFLIWPRTASSEGAADLKQSLTGSAQGSAYLIWARTASAEGAADLLKAFSGSATGAADLTQARSGSAEGAAYLQGGVTPRSDSNTVGAADLLKAFSSGAEGAAALLKAFSGAAAGAADLLKARTDSSEGAADLLKAGTGSADGSADLTQSRTGSAIGAADLLKSLTGSATGAAYLGKAYSAGSEGAADLKKSLTGSSEGAAFLVLARSGSSEGAADLKKAYSGSAEGAAALLKPSSGSSDGAADLQQARSASSDGAAALLKAYSGSSTGAAYLRPAVPVVTSVVPNTGPKEGGTEVTVSGYGFTGATSVKFGTTEATSFTVDSDMQITAVAPPGTGF